MLDGTKIKVGDKIVEFGQVYRVFKISNTDLFERVIYYRPFYKNGNNKSLVFSIPSQNLDQTRIRRPMSKKRLKKLLSRLAKKHNSKKDLDVDKAKEILNLNNPRKTIRIIKRYWTDKKDTETTFTTSKKTVLETAHRRFVEEVAFVSSTSIDEAQEKIQKALHKSLTQ